MDLMTLAAKIQLDDSDFRQGVKSAEGAGRNLANKMSAMTVAVGQMAADMAKKAISGVKNILDSSIGGYADYQQLIGGVETLFKNSANKVAKYAEQSYKATGLSANQYMETVTSFSASLLQGLKGNTEAAAELANLAITDMADNANKMGTDISSIQNAYQGFAKQNYTMLDNLKLGYGGTASEMIRLVNDSKTLDHEISDLDGITFDQLVKAIHKIQTEMGITGTTAKEAADTISGSQNSLKAAWSDLLVSVAGTNPDAATAENDPLNAALERFKTSFTTYVKNIVPTIVNSVANSGTLIEGIADSITSLPTTLLSEVTDELPQAGTKVVDSVTKLHSWLAESLAKAMDSAATNQSDMEAFGKSIGNFVASTTKDIIKYVPSLIESMATIGVYIADGLVEGLFEGFFGKGAEVDKINQQLTDELTGIDLNNNKAQATISFMEKLYNKYGEGVTEMKAWQDAQAELEKSLPGAGEVFTTYGNNIQGAIDKLRNMNEEMRRTAVVAGLENALNEQNQLLGEQLAAAEKAQDAANAAKIGLASAKEGVKESLLAYAEEYIRQNPYVFENDPQKMQARAIAEGRKISVRSDDGLGYEEKYISQMSPKQLANLIEAMRPVYSDEEESVWAQSDMDKIFSPEELKAFIASMEEYQEEVKTQESAAAESRRQAKLTQESIDRLTERAMRAYEEMAQNAEDGKTAIDTAGTDIAEALDGVAKKIADIELAGPGYHYIKKDMGLSYVPYSGFRAELHKGEAILTAAENEKYRRGGMNAAEMAYAMEEALAAAMNRVNVYMSGEKVGDLTTKRVRQNINASSYNRLRAMGG